MRLMSYIRKHHKTGIFWYRRSVPAALGSHLPVVAGFAEKPGRTEFTKTLNTRTEAEANRCAAEIDRVVQIALDEAKRRITQPQSSGAYVAPEPHPQPPPAISRERSHIKPADLFAASDRWKATEIDRLEIAILNDESTDIVGDESLGVHGRYDIQQAAVKEVRNRCD